MNDDFKIKFKRSIVSGTKIELETHHAGVIAKVHKLVLDTKEKIIRDALMDMGWVPPARQLTYRDIWYLFKIARANKRNSELIKSPEGAVSADRQGEE